MFIKKLRRQLESSLTAVIRQLYTNEYKAEQYHYNLYLATMFIHLTTFQSR